MKIAIIGAGNIGCAIADGLLTVPNIHLSLTRRNTKALAKYEQKGVQVSADNAAIIAESDMVILGLQPNKVLPFITEQLEALGAKKPILASVATNVSLQAMQHSLGGIDLPLYRIMPNTAIAVRESMTCISRMNHTAEQDELVEKLFKTVGDVMFIADENMNAATVLCACGTAYALRYIRAASQGGTEIGFHAEEALRLAAQTVKGAATLLTETGLHPEQAIDQVTTPQGCTIAGMNEMEHRGFSSAAIGGIRKSFERAENI